MSYVSQILYRLVNCDSFGTAYKILRREVRDRGKEELDPHDDQVNAKV